MAAGGHRGTLRATVDAARALAGMDVRATAVALFLALAGAAAEGVGLLLLVPILGLLTGGSNHWSAWLGIGDPVRLATVLVGGFVAAMAVRGLLLYARDMALQTLQARFGDDQRLRVMRALAAAPWPQVAAIDHARISALVGIDITRIAVMAHQIVQTIVALIAICVQLVVIAALAPGMAVLVALAMPVGGLLLVRQARARARGRDVLAAGQTMMATAAGFLGGLKIAAAQRIRERFVAEFSASQDLARDWGLAFHRDQARARLGFALTSAIGLAAVAWIGLGLGIAPARLIVVVVVIARMVGPAQAVQQSLQSIAYGLPAFEAIGDAERRFAAGGEINATSTQPDASGAIMLDGLTYRHGSGGGVHEATLTIPPGAMVGIAGPSGSGKTTLIDLIVGLFAPQAGTATIAGCPAVADSGQAIAYVPQDGFLFHDTVRRNLDWGDAAIDEAAMHDALALADASEIVARMPDGLDTVIGERGALLSGGERQRLAIARAVLRRPRLLVLDEATNALDEASERRVLDRLAGLDPRPTTLIVAHRASALAGCDRIVTVEAGRVGMVEQAPARGAPV